ncbi:sulfotransferase [Pseudomonas sp. 273]|uniref:sulfotransferase n=1 Tax=Pseudomonas sp. 273 TaxID=75692 RepID=UPI0023D8B7A2|nr:sulfotransferase [Pseudomonas sp. 273]
MTDRDSPAVPDVPCTVVFVVHGGELEFKAAMLAVSLRARLGPQARLVAALARPAAQWGELSAASYRLYHQLNIELREIDNPFGASYPIGNKFAALALGEEQGHTLFLDSDMYCLATPDFDDLSRFDAALKPADMALVPSDVDYWRPLYELAELELPAAKVLTSCSEEVMPPYYNAGFIWVRNAPRLAERWLALAERIQVTAGVEHKWPWLDQLALPLALQQLGYRPRVLTERYNFPLHLKPWSAGNQPLFCHYHDPASLLREPSLLDDLQALLQDWPSLGEVLRQDPRWTALLQRRPVVEPPRTAVDLLITGLPRSGTSYFCRLLSEREDTVIINEPAAIFPALLENPRPWGIPRLYAEMRRELLAGRAVPNKHRDGRLLDDTARGYDQATAYRAQACSPAFTLGTKNTLAYLARLSAIRQVMPWVRCVALIRHPYDCLDSWARTFEHLRNAAVQEQPLGHPDDPGLTGWQRKALLEITRTQCLPLRRALWWRYLAWQLLDAGDALRWLRYEDLLGAPRERAECLVADGPLPALEPVRWQVAMDQEERELIATVVAEVAEKFRYVL